MPQFASLTVQCKVLISTQAHRSHDLTCKYGTANGAVDGVESHRWYAIIMKQVLDYETELLEKKDQQSSLADYLQ